MIRVLTLDPGVTTGICHSLIGDDKVYISYSQEKYNELDLYYFLQSVPFDRLICEDFEYRVYKKDVGVELFSVRLIGVCQLYMQGFHPTREIFLQKPARAVGQKAKYNDEALIRMGLYVGGLQHGRDAARHFLYWFLHGYGYQFHDAQNIEVVNLEWLEEHAAHGA